MAWYTQEMKSTVAPLVKAISKKYKLKTSLSVRNSSTIVLTISQGSIDFINEYQGQVSSNYMQVNPCTVHNMFNGPSKEALLELREVLMEGNWNNTRAEIDYFDVGWYIQINVGLYNKPYQVI